MLGRSVRDRCIGRRFDREQYLRDTAGHLLPPAGSFSGIAVRLVIARTGKVRPETDIQPVGDLRRQVDQPVIALKHIGGVLEHPFLIAIPQ